VHFLLLIQHYLLNICVWFIISNDHLYSVDCNVLTFHSQPNTVVSLVWWLPGGSSGLHSPHTRCGRQCLALPQSRVETTAFLPKRSVPFWHQNSLSFLMICKESIKRYYVYVTYVISLYAYCIVCNWHCSIYAVMCLPCMVSSNIFFHFLLCRYFCKLVEDLLLTCIVSEVTVYCCCYHL